MPEAGVVTLFGALRDVRADVYLEQPGNMILRCGLRVRTAGIALKAGGRAGKMSLPSMKISSLIEQRMVKCGLSATTKEEALDEIVRVMVEGTPGLSFRELRSALSDREKLGPFSMVKGSAFPHARTEKISDFRVALGTAPGGLDFKAPDGTPVRVIVLFAVPKKHSSLYLQTLARFISLFGREHNLEEIVRAKEPKELLAAIDAAALRLPGVSWAPPVSSVTRDTPLSEVIDIMSSGNVEAVPVVDAEGNLVGELATSTLLRLGVGSAGVEKASGGMGAPDGVIRAHASCPVGELGVISTNGYSTVQEDEPLVEIAVKLSCAGARGAYVLRGRKLVGAITAGEVLRRLSGGQ